MPNTDPQVIRFFNDRFRQYADLAVRFRRASIALYEDFQAQDLGTQIEAAGAGEIIADGSETDGRSQVTGGDGYALVNIARDVAVTNPFFDAGRVTAINKVQVNGDR